MAAMVAGDISVQPVLENRPGSLLSPNRSRNPALVVVRRLQVGKAGPAAEAAWFSFPHYHRLDSFGADSLREALFPAEDAGRLGRAIGCRTPSEPPKGWEIENDGIL